jgi:NAD(P)-dependent dehydrogenase (short-subunit alcohol dehydrogenase family)
MSVRYSDFEGETVVVTGATAGIGRATALAFLRQGARVAALDRVEAGLLTLAAEAGSGTVLPITADVTDEAALVAGVARAATELGRPRFLVNNAGVDDRRPFEEMSLADWRKALALNIDHHFVLSQRVVPHMRALGGGAIVNLSSTAFKKLAPNMTSYHAAKAGIVGLTNGLARELGPANIRVNAIAPGRVVTERVAEHVVTPEWTAQTKALQCLPQLIMPDDVAQTVLWLCSSAARSITGQTIVVDGGVV